MQSLEPNPLSECDGCGEQFLFLCICAKVDPLYLVANSNEKENWIVSMFMVLVIRLGSESNASITLNMSSDSSFMLPCYSR